jgi:hypothetical protein
MDRVLNRAFALLPLLLVASPVLAQESASSQPAVVYKRGTGDGVAAAQPIYIKPLRPEIACAALTPSLAAIAAGFYPAEFAPGEAPARGRLDRGVFEKAMAGYRGYYCSYGRSAGPAVIVVVDFAKHSSVPRLYRIDLRSGDGLDSPIRVAHGIGSDPDDDGFANVFSNVQDSYTSSLGAARGGEVYVGQNGISLRLDGLEPSNSQMRARDIVVHSYAPDRRRYFNADLIAARGRPGSSEGCFVVEPGKRDWILDTLENGGYLYSGYSGVLPSVAPSSARNVIFARGTGASPQSAPVVAVPQRVPAMVSGTGAGTPGTPPTAPISPAPAVPRQ